MQLTGTDILLSFSNLLRKDWDERLEDDKLILERILILVRNVLQVPTNVRAEQRADGERQNPESIHEYSIVITSVAGP
jgi:hypothetical protein